MINGTVKNWMSSPVVTVTPETNLTEARRVMDERKIRAIPVVKDGNLIGIVTRRGLLRLDLSQLDASTLYSHVAPDKVTVGEIMTLKPITVTPSSLIPKAARIMLENKITALPVMEDDKMVGILTNSDLMRFILAEYPGLKKRIPVSHYMTDEVVTVDEDTSLLEAHRLMGTKRIRFLPVIRDGQMVGVVTRTDLMSSDPSRLASRNNQELSLKILIQPVEKVMTRSIISTAPDLLVTDVARLMLENKVHCLPVIDKRKNLVGVISESDLFLMIVQKFF